MKPYVPLLLSAAWLQSTSAQTVTCNLTPDYTAPVAATGWESKLIVTGLSRPRSILFDSEGALLIVQARTGILHLRLADGNGTCLRVAEQSELVTDPQVC